MVSGIRRRRGGWWLAEGGKVVRGDGEEILEFPLPDSTGTARALAVDHEGKPRVGADRGLFHWSGTGFEPVPYPGENGEWRVSWIDTGPSGVAWMEANGSLWVHRGDRWREVPCLWPPRGGLRTETVDGNGNFWYATDDARMAAIRPDGGEVTLTGLSRLEGTHVDAFFHDREGNVWAGITRVGLVQFRPQRFRALTPAEGLPAPMVWTVCEDGAGALWCAGEAHFVGRWQGGGLTVMSREKGNLPGLTGALWRDEEGCLLAGVSNLGVLRERGGRLDFILPSMGSNYHFLLDDRAGRRWVGTDRGLFMVADGKARYFGVAAGLLRGTMRSAAEDQAGRLWVGTAGGGAAWFDGTRFHPVTAEDGLPHDVVYALAPSADGSIWIGTVGGGLARWREGRVTRFTRQDGLPDDRVMQIIEDGLGYLWVGTRAGLARISLDSLKAREASPGTPLEIIVFDRSDGLPTREFSGGKQPAVWRGADGWLWFATTGGVASCHPGQLPLNRLPPQPRLLEARLDEGPGPAAHRPFASLECMVPGEMEIPPGPHALSFRWTAPCLISGEKMRYSFRMEGLDTEWSPAKMLSSTTYGTLAPGSYRFQVRACNHDGTWSETPAGLAITVHPYWWQRAWVRGAGMGLAAVALSLAVWLISRARHRRHLARMELSRAREAERSRIARDLHDDLGGSLTEISMLATAVPSATPDAKALRDRLTTISGKARTLVEALDEIVWAVNPRHDTADSLALYLTGFTRDFLGTGGIECVFDVPPALPHIHLEAEPRHGLFLALKEVLNNILRHSGATLARLSLTAGEWLEITVSDNGRGLPGTEGSQGGDGLTNLRERLDSLGGVCEVTSRRGEGTTVRLRIPLARQRP